MTDVLPLDVLTTLILLPIIGAALVFIIPDDRKRMARWAALGISVAVLLLSIGVFYDVQTNPLGPGEWAFESQSEWFPQINASWHVGVDGLSAAMVLLTGILVPLAIVIAFEDDRYVSQYMALFLFLEAGMMGVFVSLDMMIFFLFWEIGLVPMYFLIFLWGGENRRYAANKFFLYTMAGSLGLLLATQFIGWKVESFDIPVMLEKWPLMNFDSEEFKLLGFIPWDVKYFALLGFAVAFLIKMPAWPFHTWLPDAHTEAPTAGSMLLAGVLLKLGAYGFLRLAIPLFPDIWIAERTFFDPLAFKLVDVLGFLAMMGIVMGGLAAWGQNDFKRLVAYSSVNHMGFVVLGLAVAALMYGTAWAEQQGNEQLLAGVAGVDIEQTYENGLSAKVDEVYTFEAREHDRQDARTALNGAVFQMFNHGLSSAGMFLLAGALYHKAHTRDLRRFGGLWDIVPIFGGVLIFVSMASLGLPGLNGFVGEFLVVAGSFKAYPVYVLLSMFGLLVTGIYILKGIQKLLHGPKSEEWAEYHETKHSLEIERRELVALVPLMVLMLITGLYPNWVLNVINDGVTNWFSFLGG